jgi:hypothetical protein
MHENTEKAVAAFLRNALAQRYAADNLRRYAGFNGLSDTQLENLRAFGLHYIYPEWQDRCFQQQAFDALTGLLGNPMRLKPLVAAALKSMFRFGRHLPRAIAAGKQVIQAFEATRSLEATIINSLAVDTAKPSEAAIVESLKSVSRETFESFVADMTSLMALMAERKLLDTGYQMLKDIGAAMERRQEYYDEIERMGMRYALQIMEEGLALFSNLDDDIVGQAIAAIPQVERDWYESMTKHAGS